MALLSNGVFVALAAGVLFVLAYKFYGRYIVERVVVVDPDRTTPSHLKQDGIDYVPTRKPILFGHHFASIAGLGPIVGPAVAVYWGWVPAILWVVFGSILIGAVHDVTALGCSLRHEGRGIGDLTSSIIGPRARMLFLLIIFFMLALAMGLFVFIIAIVFVNFHPESVIPVASLMIIATLIGLAVYKWNVSLGVATILGLVPMFLFIWVGLKAPVPLYKAYLSEGTSQAIEQAVADGGLASSKIDALTQGKPYANLPAKAASYFTDVNKPELANEINAAGASARTTWIYLLLGYAGLASVLPVWLLLQPRDYLNSYKLYIGLILIVAGLVVYAFTAEKGAAIVAPKFNEAAANDKSAPPWIPFLFITVACGACSGFHNLVSSGTTVRQIASERDCRPVGYGAMILEGMLAVLVILACTVPYANVEQWSQRYASWSAVNQSGIGVKLDAFISGAAQFVAALGVNEAFAAVFMSVVVVAFAMTTLDSATRLLRFNVEEISKSFGIAANESTSGSSRWTMRIGAAMLAVVAIGFFAVLEIPTGAVDANGAAVKKPAGIVLLLLFGTSNQLLAGLGLLTVSIWLLKSGRNHWVTFYPMIFMLAMTITAMFIQLKSFWNASPRQWIPFITCTVILGLALWLIIEAVSGYGRYAKERGEAIAGLPAGGPIPKS
jgi:carbon starvation protein